MEKKARFEKAKEILESLNVFNFYDCNFILKSVNKLLKYGQKTSSFSFEETQIL